MPTTKIIKEEEKKKVAKTTKSPVKKEKIFKPSVKKNDRDSVNSKVLNTTKETKTSTSINKQPDNRKINSEVMRNPSVSPIFDVFTYREIFMALREKLDKLYEKRDKSEKDFHDYDEAVYNIIANSTTEAGAQDFLSYCYKKGKYDFCLMNHEKYMKWSLLAAATGNAFTLSKLQIFFVNPLEDILTLNNHDYLLDFLEISPENYYILISKMLCEEMVNNLNISAESLIKMPEVYQEENKELQRTFDLSKTEATKVVKENLKNTIDQLGKYLELQDQKIKEDLAIKKEKLKTPPATDLSKEEDSDKNQKNDSISSKEELKIQRPKIKKFRW